MQLCTYCLYVATYSTTDQFLFLSYGFRHADKSSHERKLLLHFWFKFLLLFCVLAFVMAYILPGSTTSNWTSWTYRKFFSQRNRSNSYPPYRAHWKISKTLNRIDEPQQTTAPPGMEYHQAYPRNYHFIMDDADVCASRKPFLVLMVPVAPHNVEARDAIRQTWANSSLVRGEVVLTLFLLGLPSGGDVQQQQEKLKRENQQHLDLIQSNFVDTYLNLTIKTLVIMDWLASRCPTAAYAMKIDSDMFLNVDNLVLMLQKPGIPKTRYLTGMLMWNIPVIRSKDSKWYVPEELYPDPHYPTYTLGMGYVFSNDLPEKFVEVSKWIKPFNIEDAYIGMCMKKLGIPLTPPPDPGQFRSYNQMYNRCEYSKIITYILGSSQELVKYWTDLKKPGAPC